MRLLYILNVANRVNNFSYAAMLAAKELGIEFYIAGKWGYASDAEREADARTNGIHVIQLDLDRSPYSPQNRVAYRQICDLIRTEHIDAIHCNTPVGGMLGRLAGAACGVQKVIYQAHGFHFYKGASLFNWCTYYPVEKWLAHKTDALITINHEDYDLACRKMKLRRGGSVYYVPGVGVDVKQYAASPRARDAVRAELGLLPMDFVLVSAGRLEPIKNNGTLIAALQKTACKQVKLLLCGEGEQRDALEQAARDGGVSDRVVFAGNRSDMPSVYAASDALALASYQEGLPRTVMEAMACGLPCVVSAIRGNTDLIAAGENGFVCAPRDADAYAAAMDALARDGALCRTFGENNRKKICDFDVSVVKARMMQIYGAALLGRKEQHENTAFAAK